MSERPEFQLPKSIHRYLATLSKMYEREGERQLQEILVNSRVQINEGVASEDWVFGHALHLMVPESLFNFTAKETLKLEKKLKEDLNSRRPFQNEFISDVFLELDIGEDEEGDARFVVGIEWQLHCQLSGLLSFVNSRSGTIRIAGA
jgi:hypothetical protein